MECTFCGKTINNKGSLKSHELCCRENPNRVIHPRSTLAGAKKGNKGPTKGMKFGRLPHWDDKFPLETVFVPNSTYPRHCLKKRILANDLLKYECACCGIGPLWLGKPMPLILDHINGINNDNTLSNLRFVCSNCDTQLSTYKSRNRTKLEELAELA